MNDFADVEHVLRMPVFLTKNSARRVAQTVPADATLILFDLSDNFVMFKSGALELMNLVLKGQWRTATLKDWPEDSDMTILAVAARENNCTHQFAV